MCLCIVNTYPNQTMNILILWPKDQPKPKGATLNWPLRELLQFMVKCIVNTSLVGRNDITH